MSDNNPLELPKIYPACAHPQSVWFEEHWRPIFNALAKENEGLKNDLDHMNHCADLVPHNVKLNEENTALRDERDAARADRDRLDEANVKLNQEVVSLRESLKGLVAELRVHECAKWPSTCRLCTKLAKIKQKHGDL